MSAHNSSGREFQYLRQHLTQLMDAYAGECVVLMGEGVVAHNKDAEKAYNEARKK